MMFKSLGDSTATLKQEAQNGYSPFKQQQCSLIEDINSSQKRMEDDKKIKQEDFSTLDGNSLNFLDDLLGLAPLDMRNLSTGQNKYSTKQMAEKSQKDKDSVEFLATNNNKEYFDISDKLFSLNDVVQEAESLAFDLEDRAEDFNSQELNMNLDQEQQDDLKVENPPLATSNSKRGNTSDSLDEIPPNVIDNLNRCRKTINNYCNKTGKIKNKITKRQKPHQRIKIIIKVVKNSKQMQYYYEINKKKQMIQTA